MNKKNIGNKPTSPTQKPSKSNNSNQNERTYSGNGGGVNKNIEKKGHGGIPPKTKQTKQQG